VSGPSVSGVAGGLPWMALAMIGLPGGATGGYLTYVRWADRPAACYGIGECRSVQTSSYSEVAGVPVALLGLLYFIAVSALAVARLKLPREELAWAPPAALSLALAATGFAAYLAYVEVSVLDAICAWCMTMAGLTALSLGLTVWAALPAATGPTGRSPAPASPPRRARPRGASRPPAGRRAPSPPGRTPPGRRG